MYFLDLRPQFNVMTNSKYNTIVLFKAVIPEDSSEEAGHIHQYMTLTHNHRRFLF